MKKILFILLLIAFAANIFTIGSALSWSEVWGCITGDNTDFVVREIVLRYRLPKAVAAILCGCALSISGLLMQTLFRNPLAGPDVLGVSAGATLGVAVLTMGFGGTLFGVWGTLGLMAVAAVAGAFAVMFVVIWLSARVPQATTLLIVGLMMGYFISSAVSLLQNMASPDTLKLFTTWTFGSLSSINESQLIILAVCLLLAATPVFLLAGRFDIMQLGDTHSTLLGINVRRLRLVIICCSSLLTGVVTAFAGPISFIGITMPHLARGLTRSAQHGTLLPISSMLGSTLLLLCNFIAELPTQPLPLNAITACFGAPILIYVIMRTKHYK